jgi:rubrerythrin
MPEEYLDQLLKAFALESRLAARAEMLAIAAQADGAEALARVLRAQTASRQVRARRLLRLARGKISRGREAVLQTARSDQEQASELYDSLLANAAGGLEHSARVERLMPGMLQRAAKAENAPNQEGYAVCQVCGFVKQGAAPQRCPVCGALKSKFEFVV